MSDGSLWALLNVFCLATQIWASTGRMLFYLLCKIVSGFYTNIRKDIDFIASDIPSEGAADRLTKLMNQHSLVYRCVEQLNVSFGHFLLIEITFIFVTEINTAMYILEALCAEPINWLHVLGNLSLIVYWIVNFSIICLSSHQIENEVLKCI